MNFFNKENKILNEIYIDDLSLVYNNPELMKIIKDFMYFFSVLVILLVLMESQINTNIKLEAQGIIGPEAQSLNETELIRIVEEYKNINKTITYLPNGTKQVKNGTIIGNEIYYDPSTHWFLEIKKYLWVMFWLNITWHSFLILKFLYKHKIKRDDEKRNNTR